MSRPWQTSFQNFGSLSTASPTNLTAITKKVTGIQSGDRDQGVDDQAGGVRLWRS